MGASQSALTETSIHQFTVKDGSGRDVDLGIYKDKVLLVVNVASKCGFTNSNYTQLTELYKKYKSKDFEILAFPCNQFLHQEPQTEQEIKDFACTRFKAEFPIFQKVKVNGPETVPVYKFLKASKPGFMGNRIKWNFTKFLIDKEGKVIGRYGTTKSPLSIEMQQFLRWWWLLLWALSCGVFSTDGAASITRVIIVDQSGQGSFTTLQSAIDSLPDGNSQWIQIYVKQGTYREKVFIPASKGFIVLQGEGPEKTVITWSADASRGGTMNSATFSVFANDFVARNIGFVNTFKSGSGSMQAIAALVGGDRNSFHGCAFIGYQDTLCDYLGRHYFDRCWIEGAIDFIFGFGQSIYNRCVLNSVDGGWLTAHAKMGADSPGGFVFKHCTIRATKMAYLGRAWNQHSTVVFHETSMPSTVRPEGWDAWHVMPNQYQTTFVEDGNIGAGSNTSGRVSWLKSLPPDQLQGFLSIGFLGPDRWLDKQP
ncbi:pectinesterase [Musa troglodytarum]|uniref:Multifunctional fusion protein n=1 Tax=Musa troglodytarum TaxID=320322 RepID=A0A9E7FYH4_9LILI|nr:pectinesterase [Musa troglodytarum]